MSKLDLDGVLAAEEVVAGGGARHRHEAWRWFGPCADVPMLRVLIQGFADANKSRGVVLVQTRTPSNKLDFMAAAD